MTDHLLLLEHHIMVILLLELLKTLFADMQHKLGIMYQGDSVGIAMVYLYNTKSISNLKLLIKNKFCKWVLQNTIINVEISSWNIRTSGKVLSIDLEDGLILKMIIKLLTLTSWNLFGTSSNNFSIKALFIEEEKLCLIQMDAQQYCLISKSNKIINKSVILHFMLIFLWLKIQM